jgi:hypothetical protein
LGQEKKIMLKVLNQYVPCLIATKTLAPFDPQKFRNLIMPLQGQNNVHAAVVFNYTHILKMEFHACSGNQESWEVLVSISTVAVTS